MSLVAACPDVTRPTDELSDRERELLSLMAAGLSNAGISRKLYLSPKTVETHVRSIFMKLGLPPEGGSHRRVMAVLMYLADTGAVARPTEEYTRAELRPAA